MAESIRKADCSDFDELEMPVLRVFGNNNPLLQRESASPENILDSAVASMIDFRLKTKPLPLVLRKRLLYQRLIGG